MGYWKDHEHSIIPPLTNQISAAMLRNTGVFLKKAAEEIAGHKYAYDGAFDADRATLITVFKQIPVELASIAMVLKHENFAASLD